MSMHLTSSKLPFCFASTLPQSWGPHQVPAKCPSGFPAEGTMSQISCLSFQNGEEQTVTIHQQPVCPMRWVTGLGHNLFLQFLCVLKIFFQKYIFVKASRKLMEQKLILLEIRWSLTGLLALQRPLQKHRWFQSSELASKLYKRTPCLSFSI